MPRFRVILARRLQEYASIDIEAETSDSAEAQALALADAKQVSTWEPIHATETPACVLDVDIAP